MKTGTFRGFTVGGPTSDVGLLEVDGLDDFESDTQIEGVPWHHGGTPSGGYSASRDVTLTMLTRALRRNPAEVVRRLKLAFSPSGLDEHPFAYLSDDDEELVFYARCVGRASPYDRDSRRVGRKVVVRLQASDPRIYSQAEYQRQGGTYTTGTPIPWTGRVWGDPWSGSQGDGDLAVTVGGAFPTWPRFEITGPTSGMLVDPKIEYITGGAYLQFTADGGLRVGPGETFVVETNPRSRTLEFVGGGGRWNTLARGSNLDGFEMSPGSNAFRFRASGDTAGSTLTVKWRDAQL